jgi:hypothetical protein
MVAGLCYKKCKSGYHYLGGNLCEPDGGPGIKVTSPQRMNCPSGSTATISGCTNGDPYGRGVGVVPNKTNVYAKHK